MSRNQVDDEFVAVRVQDPRIQNEGSWNSYVDYKIFIHTNSKAFTAKTSCVRRRYSEFVWLKKKLQKNAGLVPVPDLPGKSIFYFSNEDFLERRRKGLQVFLNKVVHMTVCLSDSQLHLFLQTQMPVGHIQDCVQGLTPFSVMDAILTYASSNQGLVQAQEEESIREPSLTISYESMESPAPHQPHVTPNSEVLPCEKSTPLVDILDSDEMLHKKKPPVRISQKSNHLEVVVEDREPTQATFYLGENPRDPGSLSSVGQTEWKGYLIQTPVEVHCPMETDGRVDNMFEEEEISVAINTDEKAVDHLESKKNKNDSEPEMCVESEEVLSLRVTNMKEDVEESVAAPEDVCSEKFDLGEGQSANVKSERKTNSDDKISDGSGCKDETILQSEICVETQNVGSAPEVEPSDLVQQMLQQEVEHTEEDGILLETPNMNGAPEVEPDYLLQERHKQEVEHMNSSDVLLQSEVHEVTQDVDRAPEVEPSDAVQEKHQQEVEHTDKNEILLETPNVNGAPEVEPDYLAQERHKQEAEHMDKNDVLQSEVHENSAPEVEPSDLMQEKHQKEVEHMEKEEPPLQSEIHQKSQKGNGTPEGEPRDSVQEKQEEVEHTNGDEILQSELHMETHNVDRAPEVEPSDSVQQKLQQEVEHTDKNDVPFQSEVHVNGAPEVELSESVQQKLQQEVEHTDKDGILLETSNVNSAPEYQQEVEHTDENDVLLQSEVHLVTQDVNGAPEGDPSDSVQEKHQREGEHTDKDESEEDSHSLTSSDESIIKRSEEESVCEDTEDVRNWPEEEASNKNILDLHMNGSLEDEEYTSGQEDGDQQHTTNIKDRIKSPGLQPTTAENGDFSILETSCLTGGDKFTKQEAPPSPLLNGSEETHYGH